MAKIRILNTPDDNQEPEINSSWDSPNLHFPYIPYLSKVDLEAEYKDSVDFVTLYLNSPGFKLRFRQHVQEFPNNKEAHIHPVGSNEGLLNFAYMPRTVYPKLEFNMPETAYVPRKNELWVNLAEANKVGQELGMPRTRYVYDHELGHWIDANMIVGSKGFYGDRDFTSNRGGWGELGYSDTYEELTPSKPVDEHDIKRSENYADLISMRDILLQMGIFNSLEQDLEHPFTIEHLKRFKQENPKFRLFNNFTDEEIVNLMNIVADAGNTRQEDNLNLLSSYYDNLLSKGGNLFDDGGGIHIDPKNKGKFNETKRRTGKTTEELTHSSNPLTRRRAIFALNAAKWKHDDGGDIIGLTENNPILLDEALVEAHLPRTLEEYFAMRAGVEREKALDRSYSRSSYTPVRGLKDSNPDYIYGYDSCIGTALDNYGKYAAGNKTFAMLPETYGFLRIPWSERAEGDLILHWAGDIPEEYGLKNKIAARYNEALIGAFGYNRVKDILVENSFPTHGMIYAGERPAEYKGVGYYYPVFNYSNGSGHIGTSNHLPSVALYKKDSDFFSIHEGRDLDGYTIDPEIVNYYDNFYDPNSPDIVQEAIDTDMEEQLLPYRFVGSIEDKKRWALDWKKYAQEHNIPLGDDYNKFILSTLPSVDSGLKGSMSIRKDGGNLFDTGGKEDDPPFWSWENWDNMATKAEPWAAGLSLSGDAAAIGLGASGIGAEAAPFVYLGSHIPSAAIDLYLTGRSIANSDLGETLYNAAEFGLGTVGISNPKALYNLGKWWKSAFRPVGTHKGKVLFTARDFMKHTDPAYFEPAEEIQEVLGNMINTGFNIKDIINASNNSDSALEELLENPYPLLLKPLTTPEKDRFDWLDENDTKARESAALLEDNVLQWKRERANTMEVDPITGEVLHRYDNNGNEYALGGNLFADAGEVDKSNSYQLPFLGNSTWGGFPLRNAFSTNTQGKSPLTSNSYLAIDTTGHAYYKEPNTDFWLPTILTAKYYNLPISNGNYSGPTIKELPVGTLLVLPGDKYYTEGSGDSELAFPENAYDWNAYKARETYENGEIVPAALTIGLGLNLPGLTNASLAELYHSDDYKTIGRQEQVDANLELAGNAVERVFAPLMPTNYYRAARSVISPETDWDAPVVPGNEWLDTVIDLALPIAAPKIAEGAGTVLREGVGLAEDVAKYANARMGYYGDNMLSRAYGTAARRWGLPHTAYPPEYQRVLADNLRYGRLENLVFDENGNLLLGNPNPRVSHEGMVNMTTDQPVVGHSKGNWDNGSVIVVDPKAVDSNKLVSVEPSDTYGIFNDGMPVPAKSATVYTGNPRIIQLAEEAGMPYVTSPELLDLYSQILELGKTGTGLEKSVEYSATDAAEEYRKAIQGLLNKRGRPTVEDYRLLENETGLMSGVTSMEDQQLTILNQLGNIDPKAALDDPSLITAQYPNGRLVEVWSNKEMGPLGNASYRNVFYDPATTTEFDFRMFREQGLKNGYTDLLIMDEWRRLNQENPFGYRLTNWLDWADRARESEIDNAYMKAVQEGDMETALVLRDLHFVDNTPNSVLIDENNSPMHAYHNTDTDFTTFAPDKIGTKTDSGYFGRGFYFTPTEEPIKTLGDVLKDVYINLTNPRELTLSDANTGISLADNDGAIVRLGDEVFSLDGTPVNPREIAEIVATDSRQIKLADAVTYFKANDPEVLSGLFKAGDPIPLSMRDDFSRGDIRFEGSTIGLETALKNLSEEEFLNIVGMPKKFFIGRENNPNLLGYFNQLYKRYLFNSSTLDISSSVEAQTAKLDLENLWNSDWYRNHFDNANEYAETVLGLLEKINLLPVYSYNESKSGLNGFYDGKAAYIDDELRDNPEGIFYTKSRSGSIKHEVGHGASDAGRSLPESVKGHNANIKPKVRTDIGLSEEEIKYLSRDDEIRTRFMSVASDMIKQGKDPMEVFEMENVRYPDSNWYDVLNRYDRETAKKYMKKFRSILLPAAVTTTAVGLGLSNTSEEQ